MPEDVIPIHSNFHFQDKIDNVKNYYGGLRNKFDEVALNAKGKISVAIEDVDKYSKTLLIELEQWKNLAIEKAQELYIKANDSELLAKMIKKIQATFNEKSEDIKRIAIEKKAQLRKLFKLDQEEKALLELF